MVAVSVAEKGVEAVRVTWHWFVAGVFVANCTEFPLLNVRLQETLVP